MEQHARPAPAHDAADGLALRGGIAMDGAGAAEGLDRHARAAAEALGSVVAQCLALGAESGGCMMVAMAEELDHFCHGLTFLGTFFFDGQHGASPLHGSKWRLVLATV